MHQIFRLDEIFEAICWFVKYESDGGKTLAALTRTCRTFENVALAALWESQDSLVPLARCLGAAIQETWKSNENIKPTNILVRSDMISTFRSESVNLYLAAQCTERLPTLSEWKREHKHALFIKTFVSSQNPSILDHSIDTTVFIALFAHGSMPFFPNLQEFQWPLRGISDGDIPFITRFLGPKLEKITLNMPNNYKLDMLTLDHLLTIHALKEMSLKGEAGLGSLLSIRELITRSVQLRAFTCTIPLDLTHVRILATLRSLHRLSVIMPPMVDESFETSVGCDDPFPVLQTLTLAVSNLAGALHFIQLCPFTHVAQFELEIQENSLPDSPRYLEALGTLMVKQFSSKALQAFRLTSECGSGLPWDTTKAIRASTLRPFLSFRNLAMFHLDANWCYDLHNSFIEEAAKAWPSLRYIFLDPWGSWPVPRDRRLTLACFLPLVQHCPRIRNFAGLFEGCVPYISDTTRPGNGHEAEFVRDIFVGHSVSDIEAVALFLSDLFPHLEQIRSLSEADDTHARWEEVTKKVKEYTLVRSQMKAWYKEKDATAGPKKRSET
ncbi:unnamed protein product [Somion occarium]|uniref:F-box domain-containing protein n=1 Tax=Somion occarium TaxID=3059160 RepID=A0ABP1DDS2_9APHY